jgi:ABC-type oligopeptide transport system ATPase subunit
MHSRLLEFDHVTRSYTKGALFQREQFNAVDDVSFTLDEGSPEIFAIIGESGSGKTTLARMMLNLVAPTSGSVRFRGNDLSKIHGREQRLGFMQQVQPIFQNPFGAFNPLKKVDRYLFATARRFAAAATINAVDEHANQSLRHVGLSLDEVRGRYPHELSGGQLQRIAIARALISKPALLVADEPVSMVDASLRMSIVNLFRALRDDLNVSIVYITHDLATAYYISDRIIIMQNGRIVEHGDARKVLSAPEHPYSRRLRDSVLSPDPAERDQLNLSI